MINLLPLALSLSAPLFAATPSPVQIQEPTYPEGLGVSRALTPAERAWMAINPPPTSGRAATPPPSGPIHCVAEYEPMDGILVSWDGTNGQNNVLAEMAKHITLSGNAKVYCVVDTNSEINSASNTISNKGADMSKVEFVVKRTDSIWIRDYGPRYVYQGDCRAVIDHDYNRPRNNDNAFPSFFSGYKNQAWYDHDLEHGGGNFHLDALGYGYATKLILNENQTKTTAEVVQTFDDFQNLGLTILDAFPTSVDSTQHLDMWMQITSDNTVVISDWPAQSGSTQDNICDAAAIDMAARGYQVFRTPARRTSGFNGNHYTYTNVVMCNDLVIIPEFTNSSVSSYNSQALSTWQSACPGKTIVQINADAVVSYAGVLHCIMMHVPVNRGGVIPTAYLVEPNGGSFSAGEQVDVSWISDDDLGVSGCSLDFSSDNGQTWSSLANNLGTDGTWTWTVPNINTSQALLRINANDANGNTGEDTCDATFSIGGGGSSAQLIPYGTGKPGSNGIPILDASATPVLGTQIQFQIGSGFANGKCWLISGPSASNGSFDGGSLLVNHNDQTKLTLGTSGAAAISVQVPNQTSLVGLSWFWQAWIADDPQASGQGWTCTNGLETVLGY